MLGMNTDRELVEAAKNGDVERVRRLLPVSDPKAGKSFALRLAAVNGHEECVRLLLPGSDPKAEDSQALRLAAGNGHEECVRLLLPHSDPNAENYKALRWAAENGHVECVKHLLAQSAPLVEMGQMLQEVIDDGHAKVAALLIAQAPKLLDGINLSKGLAVSIAKGHADMAGLLSSIVEQRELLAIVQNPLALHSTPPPSTAFKNNANFDSHAARLPTRRI